MIIALKCLFRAQMARDKARMLREKNNVLLDGGRLCRGRHQNTVMDEINKALGKLDIEKL